MFTRSRVAVTTVSALSLLLLAACSSGGSGQPAPSGGGYGQPAQSSPPAASAPMSPPAAADAATLKLKLSKTSLGDVLTDGKGMTLYLFTKDTANASNCSGACLVAWPALIGKPTAGSGVDAAKLGSFARADGSTQASYNGKPLYYWKDDTAAGDVKGQKVNGVWFVINKAGEAVQG